MTEISRTHFNRATRVVEDSGDIRVYTRFELSAATKALDVDPLGFTVNKGDYVWYVDTYKGALKIGEVLGKTKASIRVSSFVSGVSHSERNVPRHRIYKLDPDYLKSLTQASDGFVLPTLNKTSPVVDVAGNVLSVGDPVIFSHSNERGFVVGTIEEIKTANEIRVTTFSAAVTASNWDGSRLCFDNALDKQAYRDITPSNATSMVTHALNARSSNILKVTAIADGKIQDLHNSPSLLALMKMVNMAMPDDFKGGEDYVFEQKWTVNPATHRLAHAHNGFDVTIVSNGVESFEHIALEAKSFAAGGQNYLVLQ